MSDRPKQVEKEIMKCAGQFFAQHSNRTSMITVTSVDIAPDFKRASIGISVLPESEEGKALSFAKRRTRDLRDYVVSKLTTKFIPRLDVIIDQGEKNRQRIQEISKDL